LWLMLVVLMLGSPLAGVRAQEPMATISIDPPFIYGLYPGDTFDINLVITDASNVYAWQTVVNFAWYMSTIAVVTVVEGGFMKTGGDTFMSIRNDPFHGFVGVGVTLTEPDVGGVSGPGTLATITFTVLEAGECPLEFTETKLLDPTGLEMPHTTVGGYYLGSTADLIPPAIPPRPHGGGHAQREWRATVRHKPGDALLFTGDVVNTGYTNLDVRLKYTSVRESDGKKYVFYNGQAFQSVITYRTEYYYVDQVTYPFGPSDWTEIGTAPYLDAPDDGNYVQGTTMDHLTGAFGFQNITGLGPLDKIFEVRLEGYTRSASLDIDFDAYDTSFRWFGSLWGTASYAWQNPRWTTDAVSTVYSGIKTVSNFNKFRMLFAYYTPDGSPMGNADLDCVRLKVTIETGGLIPVTPKVYMDLAPGDIITPAAATWLLTTNDYGHWFTTIEAQYLMNYDARFPQVWLYGLTTFTYEWWCSP